jgi:crotonobetaine/carnitine-CoA ligase
MLAELAHAESVRPDATLLRWREGSWTVREFAEAARHMANGLRQRGIGPGDRVAVSADNSADYAALGYGIHLAGAVEVPVNVELRGPLLKHVLDDGDAHLLLVEPAHVAAIIACGATATVTLLDEDLLESFRAAPPIEYSDPAPHELASIIYTSGTTGPSKGVMLSHGYYPNLGDVWRSISDITADDVSYWVFPFSHVDARMQLAVAVLAGSTMAFVPRFSANRFWDDIRDFGATWFGAVGWMLSVLASLPPPPRDARLRLRRGVCVPIPAEGYEFFEDGLGIVLQEIYGQTEGNSPSFGTLDRRRRGSAGWLCSGFDVAVVGTDGEELAAGQRGEIVYRPGGANMVCQGYWRRPEATMAAYRDLWFHSGDLGHFDEDGFLWFSGRMKDVIRSKGENVSAFELETTIRAAPGVAECVATAVRGQLGGEDEIRVFVVAAEGVAFDLAAFQSYCAENLARFAVPRYLELVDEAFLIRGQGTGAVQKHRLPAELGENAVDLQALARAR